MNSPAPIAVITGGTGYLGQAITGLLNSHGWNVVILSRSHSEVKGATVHVCDITDEEQVRTTMQKIMNGGTLLSACIHAASPHLARKPIVGLTLEECKDQMDVAFLGAFLLAKYATPYLTRDGAFIGITSAAIEPGASPGLMGSYPAAKSALRALLRSLAKELAPEVRVYAVAPGFLPGGLNADLPLSVREFISRKAGKDAQTPEAVAELILDLLQKTAAYAPGSSIDMPSRTVSPL